jgi:hypothetical protein
MKVFQMWISKSVVLSISKQINILATRSDLLPPIGGWDHVFCDEVLSRRQYLVSLISALTAPFLEVSLENFYC